MIKKILLGIVGIFVLIIIAYFAFSAIAEDVTSLNPKNTMIYAVLAEAGLKDVIVDNTPDGTVIAVSYTGEEDPETVAFYAMGAASLVDPNTPNIEVELYKGETKTYSVKAITSDVKAFADGQISEEEFYNKLEITK
jgi:uncharacterized protein YxeA